MTITTINGINFVELATSRQTEKSYTSRTEPLVFMAWETQDQDALNTAFALLVGTIWDGLPLDTLTCVPKGGGVWECTAKFAFTAPQDPANDDGEALGIAYSVDLSAGTVHITQSLETIATVSAGTNLRTNPTINSYVYPDNLSPSSHDIGATVTITGPDPPFNAGTYTITGVGIDANGASYWVLDRGCGNPKVSGGLWSATTGPDYRQAIGVTRDAVSGTDIFFPKFEFGLTVRAGATPLGGGFPVTLDFFRTISAIEATTNNAEWKGFPKGTVIYLGMNGQCQPDELWTLTHKFAVGANRTVQITPQIQITKKAWEYLWCAYAPQNVGGLVLNVPRVAKVERVYEESDFNLLRLNPPICDWTATPESGTHPLIVQFTDLSSGTPLTWLWTFGDGSVSILKNPIYIYTIPGVYTVSLTVTNGAGSSFKTVFNAITVS